MSKKWTRNEGKIFQVISEAVLDEKELKVSEVARKAQVSPASVIKLAKKKGYSGYTEMILSLRNDLHVDKINPCEAKGDSLLTLSEASIFLGEYDDYFYIEEESCLVVLGVGICDSAALYLRGLLARKGINSHANSNAKSKTSEDMAIIFSEGGIVPYREAKKLKESGFKIISFTSVTSSPLAKISDLVIEVQASHSSPLEYVANFFTANLYIYSTALADFIKIIDK